jgi:ubiquinone/menaquinone biosynthesis C-methylase UbiE
MLARTDVKDKKVADIGCGTGRHWHKIIQQQPLELAGFDVSAGMLSKLKLKFPQAETHLIVNDLNA